MNKVKALFVCKHNAVRSQICQVLLNERAPELFSATSAGLEPGEKSDFATQLLAELDIDISTVQPQSVFDLHQQGKRYDFLITIGDEKTLRQCPRYGGPMVQYHWDIPDPLELTGTRQERLDAGRAIRDLVIQHCEGLIRDIEVSYK